ncbi:GTP cyclohydrolase I FolE (plasmid) [Deinococcus metallilatus]|uniref:GTP cyclohydrolase 1 n=1 Tax=Deinococcus metallilatus TaxID=1211322 RepID=A0AAJ5F7P6_9DEIO|nr:GTP cyclohydrolase I FolE [Deinococcus metallilatus]MBB5295661.1 GTP cyclohydrolase I [Deinococcus metallilatus]QBY06881.1 GTP cyclohydrolase I FolE [Deinococcus metallilatus]TLK32270.1 GTP cyclohydrolase I FolE [Deinococcus metallilatus]GMA14191.1 GTP cyclohydrolase 1 [Deinococcus metallilatus]
MLTSERQPSILPGNPPRQHQHLGGLSELTQSWLEAIGEDPEREGLRKTPQRVAKAWDFITRGYQQELATVANGAVFQVEGSEMVIVKDIEFYSMCEHHMLPFFGRAHIGYLPNAKILGLSKFARITDMFARRLQVQERLTAQIAQAVQELLEPSGVGVVLEGIHLCMAMRGVEKQHSATVTTSVFGLFREDSNTRKEFMQAIHQR